MVCCLKSGIRDSTGLNKIRYCVGMLMFLSINITLVKTHHSALTPLISQDINSHFNLMKRYIMNVSTNCQSELSVLRILFETLALTNVNWLYIHKCIYKHNRQTSRISRFNKLCRQLHATEGAYK